MASQLCLGREGFPPAFGEAGSFFPCELRSSAGAGASHWGFPAFGASRKWGGGWDTAGWGYPKAEAVGVR